MQEQTFKKYMICPRLKNRKPKRFACTYLRNLTLVTDHASRMLGCHLYFNVFIILFHCCNDAEAKKKNAHNTLTRNGLAADSVQMKFTLL